MVSNVYTKEQAKFFLNLLDKYLNSKMRESDFIAQNREKWERLEQLLASKTRDPEELSQLFVQVTDDLSYARTFYANRSVRVYLNNLAQRVYQSIYKNNRSNQRKFISFWTEELPVAVYKARRQFIVAFLLFVLSFSIGVLSSINDGEFAKSILGERYVEMTKENIAKGDPMAVYKERNDLDMFSYITLNNIRVAFMTFIFGALYAVGTVGLLIYNGIMVGTFQYFFIERGLFQESFLTIWMHGALEISSIVIAGAAGLIMGRGLVFPGTYPRMQAFRLSAVKGLKILLGIVPVIMIAAFIETFFTQYTEAPDILRAVFIVLCFTFVIWYFVLHPIKVYREKGFLYEDEASPEPAKPYAINLRKIKPSGEVFTDVFAFYKKHLRKIVLLSILIAGTYTAVIIIFFSGRVIDINFIPHHNWLQDMAKGFAVITNNLSQIFSYSVSSLLFLLNTLTFTILVTFLFFLWNGDTRRKPKKAGAYFLNNFPVVLCFMALIQCLLLSSAIINFFLLLGVMPVIFMFMNIALLKKQRNVFLVPGDVLTQFFQMVRHSWGFFFGVNLMFFLLAGIFFFVIDTPFMGLYMEILQWMVNFTASQTDTFITAFMTFTTILGLLLITPLFVMGNIIMYYHYKEIQEAKGLEKRVERFGNRKKAGRFSFS